MNILIYKIKAVLKDLTEEEYENKLNLFKKEQKLNKKSQIIIADSYDLKEIRIIFFAEKEEEKDITNELIKQTCDPISIKYEVLGFKELRMLLSSIKNMMYPNAMPSFILDDKNWEEFEEEIKIEEETK